MFLLRRSRHHLCYSASFATEPQIAHCSVQAPTACLIDSSTSLDSEAGNSVGVENRWPYRLSINFLAGIERRFINSLS